MRKELYHKLKRVYVTPTLISGGQVTLIEQDHHYLKNVLRLEIGNNLKLFNGADGEFLARIIGLDKKSVVIEILEQLIPQSYSPFLGLIFAPLKGHKNSEIIEKSTELGVTHIYPILTDRTITREFNGEKYLQVAINAAEQCERLDVPKLFPLGKFYDIIATLVDYQIVFFDEFSSIAKIRELDNTKPTIILVGPEGGFSDEERNYLKPKTNVISASLGRNILRADTAIYAGLAIIKEHIL